jgi:hypothetical protein
MKQQSSTRTPFCFMYYANYVPHILCVYDKMNIDVVILDDTRCSGIR